jgi:hypothetical protein
MKLLTTYFKHKLDIRNQEFRFCLTKNADNVNIDEIYLFYENYEINYNEFEDIKNHKKIKIIPIGERMTYKIAIEYARENFKDDICIISNTDIYFDKSLNKLNNIDLDNKIICLTAFWKKNSLRDTHGGTQDAWIFRNPLKEFFCDIKLGIGHCECFFHQEAKDAGLQLSNPCYDIKAIHYHNDPDIYAGKTRNLFLDDGTNYFKNLRNSTIISGYHLILPCHLNEIQVINIPDIIAELFKIKG